MLSLSNSPVEGASPVKSAMAPTLSYLTICLFIGFFVSGCVDEEDTKTWAYIQPNIIVESCATVNCHSNATQARGIALEDFETSYDVLVNGGFVIPENPERSFLVALINGDGVRFPMPIDRPLSGADIDLIETWIAEGARKNP